MAKRNEKHAHLVEPTWGQSDDGGPPLTELSASVAGPLSPFGQDHSFPCRWRPSGTPTPRTSRTGPGSRRSRAAGGDRDGDA
ncbi:hypothetical protein [Blastococcus brunescens]|uniref:Uncharacterized protein n=1 Tax=Blastococcus brunescens TaxID=1564165 RepID=A0ABZ1B5F0_9ACTN|nr:hypothetical protein [Blastococcus sp. BMG 8361]WRL64609.1 hypothetical protein U6N30_02060 [Blastococcus sp. BMG 8361]